MAEEANASEKDYSPIMVLPLAYTNNVTEDYCSASGSCVDQVLQVKSSTMFTQGTLARKVVLCWNGSPTGSTRLYSICIISLNKRKVWTMYLQHKSNAFLQHVHESNECSDFILFHAVPPEDYIGLYSLQKHDTIGGNPVSWCMYM